MPSDPYRHHPGLRGLIKPAEDSFFRDFQPAQLDQRMAELGRPPTWRYTEDEREAYRERVLAKRPDGDLWVFAYGSLIWDPALNFAEVRRAHVASHARHFILVDRFGGRGDQERPGLMAALDAIKPDEQGCDGLVFRIAADALEQETRILWRRERISPCYHETFLTAETAEGPVTALAFTADHTAEMIEPNLSREKQVEYLATGAGFLGTSLEYIQNLADHFTRFRIEDEALFSLLADAKGHPAQANL